MQNSPAQEIKPWNMLPALHDSPCSVLVTDATGCVEYVNEMFVKNSGYTVSDIIGRKPGQVRSSGQTEAGVYEERWATLKDGRVWHGDLVNRHKDGDLLHERATIVPVIENGIASNYLSIQHGIGQSIADQNRLSHTEFARLLQ